MTASHLIREARLRAGMTQTALATALDTYQSVIARWETGRTQPDYETVVRAVRAAGFDLAVSLTKADDHDLALIRRELRLAPHQRLTSLTLAVRQMALLDHG
ncbi:MAG: helix-turn-helix domain-containing protein [Acidimicrobiia bacterium]|nr:helix-turn-helix domain-containing protein [Acidimicrobiia bacterium]MDH5615404.1 helix-turn-helix domain-containing protein [Acidimicrobiia bacterium]